MITSNPSIMPNTFIPIKIKALSVENIGPNEWEIRIPVQELDKPSLLLLDKLFPHSEKQVAKLLEIEALISARL